MKRIEKYAHLDIELPDLQQVLLNAIQSEFLEISLVDKGCDKFMKVIKKFPILDKAKYVVYSSYVQKKDHEYEKFIFLGDRGEELCDISGRDMELYGLLKCVNIPLTEEYEINHHLA